MLKENAKKKEEAWELNPRARTRERERAGNYNLIGIEPIVTSNLFDVSNQSLRLTMDATSVESVSQF